MSICSEVRQTGFRPGPGSHDTTNTLAIITSHPHCQSDQLGFDLDHKSIGNFFSGGVR